MLAGQHFIGIILRDQRLARRLERLDVLGCPPVGELAGLVVFRALVVEMMADLVADNGADAALVDSRKIGRAHVWTPVTNAQLVCRLRLDNNKTLTDYARTAHRR